MLSGTLSLDMLGGDTWATGVPAQIHCTVNDPFRNQAWIDRVIAAIDAADAPVEVFDYPGAGHLFTDPSLPDEYAPDATGLLRQRVLACNSPGAPSMPSISSPKVVSRHPMV